jgi:hypothetical protein
MNFFIALLLLVGILILIGALSNSQGKRLYLTPTQELRPYISKPPLTHTEKIFYHRLKEALPEFIVLAQVQLSSFLRVDETQTNYQNYLKWFGPISQQSVDFLICDNDFLIIAAIELDDKSHVGVKSIARDNKKSNNLDAANVPLIRWHAEAMPEPEVIKQAVLKYVSDVDEAAQNEPEWLIDGSPSFLKKQQNPIKSIVVNVCIWFAIAMIIMACINAFKGSFMNSSARYSHKSEFLINQRPKNTNANQSEEIFEKQRREQTLREAAKLEANQARLKIIQQQNQEKLRQIEEAKLKEEMWKQYNKKSIKCTTTDDMVVCGNDYINSRASFERYWEAQRKTLNY